MILDIRELYENGNIIYTYTTLLLLYINYIQNERT